MEEPASTPRDPTCVPVRTAGGLWEVAGLVKVKHHTFYKQILGNHLSYSTNRLGGGDKNLVWKAKLLLFFFLCNFMVNYGTCISVDIA